MYFRIAVACAVLLAVMGSMATAEQPAMAAGPKQLSHQTTWNDAFGIDLNWVRSAVKIYWNGSSITSATCKTSTYARPQTGWSLVWQSTPCDVTSSYADSEIGAAFYTDICGGTATGMEENHAYATPWGQSAWVSNPWKSGCASSTFFYDTVYWPSDYV